MTTRIVIHPSEGIQKEFVAKVQSWVKEVLEKKGPSNGTYLYFHKHLETYG